jgi:hypothetical protein
MVWVSTSPSVLVVSSKPIASPLERAAATAALVIAGVSVLVLAAAFGVVVARRMRSAAARFVKDRFLGSVRQCRIVFIHFSISSMALFSFERATPIPNSFGNVRLFVSTRRI